MADDIFKGLLDRSSSPGTSFGELAGAYFSGRGKKSNRGRNLLVASLFFNAAEQRRQANVMQKLQDVEDRKLHKLANAKSTYKQYMDLLAKDKEIKEKTATRYFDAMAEDWFNNPTNHDEGFDSREYEDATSPLYRLKQKEKNEYINKILLPEHQARMSSIEGLDIKSEEDFLAPIKQAFKAEKRKVASPQNVSLVHKAFSKLGIGDDEKYQTEYNKAKSEMDIFNQKLEGLNPGTIYRFKDKKTGKEFVSPDMIDTGYSIKLTNPYGNKAVELKEMDRLGLSTKDIQEIPTYNEFEFKNTQEFKSLQSPVARQLALQSFNALDDEDKTEDNLLSVVVSSAATDVYQQQLATFNAIKNQNKPTMQQGMDEETFKNSQVYKDWEMSYQPGGKNYFKTRQQAGLPTTTLDKVRDEVQDLILFDKQVLEKEKTLSEDQTLNDDQRKEQINSFIDKRINTHVETHAQKILQGGGIDQFLQGYMQSSLQNLDSYLLSNLGQEKITQLAATKNIAPTVAEQQIRNMRVFNILQGQQAYKLIFEKYAQGGGVTDLDLNAFEADLGDIEGIIDID
jgi:hypothetical protein